MAETTLNTKIRLRYDSYESWFSNNPLLLEGEVAVAHLSAEYANATDNTGKANGTLERNSVSAPQVMVKVGPGYYNNLPFISARASDVHSWAKWSIEEFQTYLSGFITEQNAGLTTRVSNLEVDYNETIIALSVDGQTVTYVKGDGSKHSFITQDTNTTYSLATDSVTGLTKLYATTGSAEDGTMTQKAITTELDKKVGVKFDDTTNTLIFTK